MQWAAENVNIGPTHFIFSIDFPTSKKSQIRSPVYGWWAEPDLNRRPLARKAPESASNLDLKQLLERFYDFQIVDLRRAKRTAYEKVWFIRKLLKIFLSSELEFGNQMFQKRSNI
jgi:hypothetical protein